MGVDLDVFVGLFDSGDESIELFVGHLLARQDGHGVCIVGVHGLEQRHHDRSNVGTDAFDGAVGDADDVSVFDRVAMSVFCILDRLGDLAGLHVSERLRHGFDVGFEIGLGIEPEKRRERLRNALGGHDGAGFLRNVYACLGCHDDVLVVGKDQNRVCVDLVDSRENVRRGRVHGLPARNNHVDAEGLENLGVAGAGGDGHDAEGLARLFLFMLKLFGALFALELHVVDVDLGNLGIMGQEPCQNLVGAVGVNMHLEVRVHADHKVAIAHGGKELLRRVNIDRIGMNEELGAVTVGGTLPVVDLLDLDLRSGTGERHSIAHEAVFTGNGGGKGIDQDGKAETARIHDVVLLQDRKEVRRALDGSIRLRDNRIERLFEGKLLLARLLGSGGRILDHREDRAFDGLAYGLEGDFHCTSEARIERNGIEDVVSLVAFAQSAKNLRGNDAGVAACAHESARRYCLANLGVGRTDGKLGKIVHHHLHGERHVRSRVSIGNGEHIEAVDFLFALGQSVGGGSYRVEDVVGRRITHEYVYLLGKPKLLSDFDALDMNGNAFDGNLGVLGQFVGNVVDEVLRHGVDVGAVLHDDVHVDVDACLLARHDDAATKAVGGQDVREAVRGSGRSHADDAVAAQSGIAGKIGENVIRDMEISGNLLRHESIPFSRLH